MSHFDLEQMNEMDVREEIVRPLLHRLGYNVKPDSRARIRTEVPLRYSKSFLGRKDSKRDPDLRGQPDYVCEVIAAGRWIVEVKSPKKALDRDDVQQAFTYATHPDVAAYWFLLTNGREFRLHSIRSPESPVLQFPLEALDGTFLTLAGILSPEALERDAKRDRVDVGKPIIVGLRSTARIVGGYLTYAEYLTTNPLMAQEFSKVGSVRATVTGQTVKRNDQGRIQASMILVGPFPVWDEMNRLAGIHSYDFETADEFVSINREKPTIFQGITTGRVPANTSMQARPHMPAISLPFAVQMTAFTEAVGFYEDLHFRGTFYIVQNYDVDPSDMADPRAGVWQTVMAEADVRSSGDFDILIEP